MLKSDPRIMNSLEELISSIKNSEIYRNYEEASEAVSREPGLQERIDEYRRNNFLIQQNNEGGELLRKLEAFELETAAFRLEPLVDKYLCAERDFVKLKQDIDNRMLSELAFSIPSGF
ncbi:MAG: YlbF family regulator [Lachnospiraceae bacterium]|nr:YlbF family regulator [Lachnospiraceae bacterium]